MSCDEEIQGRPSARTNEQNLDEAVEDLGALVPEGEKADIVVGGIDICPYILPALEWGEDSLRMGVFAGADAALVVGPAFAKGIGSAEMVLDTYHAQFMMARPKTNVFLRTSTGASVTAFGYAGLAWGFENSVLDWEGEYTNISGRVGIPGAGWIKAETQGFVEDLPGNEEIIEDEIEQDEPPAQGIYGVSLGIRLNGTLLSSELVLPVSVTYRQRERANWQIMTRLAYEEVFSYDNHTYWQRLKKAAAERLLGLTQLDVSLIELDADTGEYLGDCPSDWPYEDDPRECVIQFGDPLRSSPIENAKHLAVAVCAGTNLCETGIAIPFLFGQFGLAWLQEQRDAIELECSA